MRGLIFLVVIAVLTTPLAAQEKKFADKKEKPPENVRLALNTGGHSGPVKGVAFTPDGKRLVTLEWSEVHVWDMATGERERTWRLPTRDLLRLAVSPNGQTVAVTTLMWSTERPRRWTDIWLLSLADGSAQRIEVDIGYHIWSLTFSPDSKRLAYSTEYQAGVIGSLFKKAHVTHRIPRAATTGVVRFSSDGARLLVGGGRPWEEDQCQVYDVTPEKGTKEIVVKKPLFSLEESSRKRPVPHHLWEADWAPDSSRFVAWDDVPALGLRVWSHDGKPEASGKGKRNIAIKNLRYINFLRFVDPDTVLAVGMSGENELRPLFVDLRSGVVTQHNFPIHKQEDLHFSASSDGSLLAVNSGPGFQVLVFDLKKNKLLHRLGKPQLAPEMVFWGPDSQSIAWSFRYSDKENRWINSGGLNLANLEPLRREDVQDFHSHKLVKGWQAKTEDADKRSDKKMGITFTHKEQRIQTEVLGPSGGVIFFKEGEDVRAVVREHWHETMHIVDAATGKIRHRWFTWGHNFNMSPDQKYVAVVKGEQTIEIYRVQGNPARVLTVLVFGPEWIAWTPQGYYAASLGGEQLMGWTIRKDGDTPLEFHPIEQFRKQLHRPDIVARVLELGGAGPAIKAANAFRKIETTKVHIEPPPTIAIDIIDKSQLPNVKVRVSAQTGGQPLTTFDLFVDGIPATNGHLEFKGGVRSIDGKEMIITLPGEKPTPYSLSAMVSTADQYGYSNTVEVPYINRNKLPRLHVLAIGINEYEVKSLKLECAASDATAILDGFKNLEKCGLFREVMGKALVNSEARSSLILSELERMQKAVNENDLAVIFFAGHGVRDKDDFYLLTQESQSKNLSGTALSGTALRQKLGGFRCQVLLLLDACYSGAFAEKQTLKPATDEAVRSLGDVDVRVAVLTAARGYEKAQAKLGRGLFTDAIVRALQRPPGLLLNDDVLYVDQLATYTLHEVRRASNGEQHPYLRLAPIVLPFPIAKFAKAG